MDRDDPISPLDRINGKIKRIQDNPATYTALCAAAGLYDEVKRLIAQTILANKDRVVFTRAGKPVTPVIEPHTEGFTFNIPGEYRDYTQIILDGVVLEQDSSRRRWLITPRGIY